MKTYHIENKTKGELVIYKSKNAFIDCITDLFDTNTAYMDFMDEHDWSDEDDIYITRLV